MATRKNRMAGIPPASRGRTASRSALAALLGVLLAGCAVNREPSTFEELGQDANTLGFGRLYPQDPNETDLQLGVGDTLLVTVEDAENLTGPRVIRQDGKITLPVIGDVMAAGLTSTEIQKKVETLLAVYLHEPKVTVAVETVVSKRYFVGALNPATGGATFLAVPYQGDTTLFDAWVGMGSPATPLDDDCHVKVIRGGVRDPRVLVVNIREMYTLGLHRGEHPDPSRRHHRGSADAARLHRSLRRRSLCSLRELLPGDEFRRPDPVQPGLDLR